MGFLYELALMGYPTNNQVMDIEQIISNTLGHFGLQLKRDVAWLIRPESFVPQQQRASAAVFFGGKDVAEANLPDLLRKAIPVVPVVSDTRRINEEIPAILRMVNCLTYDAEGAQRVATALLECAGLLPRQRRVFLSYRRDEARQASMQLFDALSSRRFDVFLDTYAIAPGDDFQAILWHRLCDCDVLVMLDTPGYFSSRWTDAEFGRALAKGMGVLRVGWPDSTPSQRTATASRAELISSEVDPATGRLSDQAMDRICLKVEAVRSQSHAVRNVNLVSTVREAIERIGGAVNGMGPNKAVYLQLADGRDIVAYPTLGVPTSLTLHQATTNSPDRSVAVMYDHVGLHPNWLGHLDWLGLQIKTVRWVKVAEAAWQFAAWE